MTCAQFYCWMIKIPKGCPCDTIRYLDLSHPGLDAECRLDINGASCATALKLYFNIDTSWSDLQQPIAADVVRDGITRIVLRPATPDDEMRGVETIRCVGQQIVITGWATP